MFIPDPFKKTVKIPVQVIDGQVVPLYGGELPKMIKITGDLIVPAFALVDRAEVEELSRQGTSEMLPAGSELLINVNVDEKGDGLYIEFQNRNVWLPRTRRSGFVRVILNEPLILWHRGTKSSMLSACECSLPDLNEKATSLNHAYTIASKRFETKRTTNTGNVFRHVYHNVGARWEKLEWLRERLDVKFEARVYNAERETPNTPKPEPLDETFPANPGSEILPRMRSKLPRQIDEAIPDDVTPAEFDELMAAGWYHYDQKFRRYNFRPNLNSIPLRICLRDFRLSKSQRKVLRINADLNIEQQPLLVEKGSDECTLFGRHNRRFGNAAPVVVRLPSGQGRNRKFRVSDRNRLIAASYMEIGASASHAYYATFDPAIEWRSLGIFTLLKEIEYAKECGHEFHYLGYAFDKPTLYDYKKRFIGLENYCWETRCWKKFERLR